MDAFAVALSVSVSLKQVSYRQVFRLVWHFGIFQALMPILGWLAGINVSRIIEHVDHWIAFGILAIISFKMINEALKKTDHQSLRKDPTKGATMVLLSIATSIDALAVGFSVSMLQVSILTPALIIGVVAGLFTLIGFYMGQLIGTFSRLGNYAEVFGGIILLIIGIHILYQHGVFDFIF